MRIAIILGSNYLIGTDGVMFIEQENGEFKEFFRVREIFRVLSDGSYLAVDVDIKDVDGKRAVKLAKSKPVASDTSINVEYDHQRTRVTREDGTVIIEVEQMKKEAVKETAPKAALALMQEFQIEAVLKINGQFNVEGININATDDGITIETRQMSRNITAGTTGVTIRRNGGMGI